MKKKGLCKRKEVGEGLSKQKTCRKDKRRTRESELRMGRSV